MNKKIHYGRHNVNQEDIDAVVSVLQSDWLTQGPMVPAFEKSVAQYTTATHAFATNSATSALHIACLALDVGVGDWVWTSANTFVASANCALYCGASVDFVDIDSKTYNMNVTKLSEKLEVAEKDGTLPKVLIPVHLCGQSCDMESIKVLSEKYGFKIIEDASHAIGGKYKGQPVGSCSYSDITVFSFHPVKIITSGEGGMALTNNAQIAERLKIFRSHGITGEDKLMKQRPSREIWNYQQIELGFNYRMTDIHAALGLSQMKRLDEFVSRRHQIAQKYDRELMNLNLEIPFQISDSYSAYHLYSIKLLSPNISQPKLHDLLIESGVNVNLHYIPVYRHPYYEARGFKKGYCPESEKYHQSALSIPMYPSLKNEEQDRVIHLLGEYLS